MNTFQFLVLPFVCALTEGARRYHHCVVYENKGDNPDVAFNNEEDASTDKVCVYDRADDAVYCRLFTCQPLFCAANQQIKKSRISRCPYCEGTCSSGGKLYKVGATFTCADQVNVCNCVSTGSMTSTMKTANKYTLCQSADSSEDRVPPEVEYPRESLSARQTDDKEPSSEELLKELLNAEETGDIADDFEANLK